MKWHTVFLLSASVWAQAAPAQDVRRCERADGSVVFTDRRCADEETEQAPSKASTQSAGAPGGPRIYMAVAPSCSRTPEDLAYGVRSAIDMRDTNQLAEYYHWVDASDAQAEQLMDRLERIVNSPLMDIQLIYPDEPEPALADQGDDMDYGTDVVPEITRQRAPYAIKLVQFRSDTSSQAQSTVFRLRRHFDCWWMQF
jgi:hypothetical protein